MKSRLNINLNEDNMNLLRNIAKDTDQSLTETIERAVQIYGTLLKHMREGHKLILVELIGNKADKTITNP